MVGGGRDVSYSPSEVPPSHADTVVHCERRFVLSPGGNTGTHIEFGLETVIVLTVKGEPAIL